MKISEEIYLTKRLRIVVNNNHGDLDNKALVATFNRNLEPLGFILSKELFTALTSSTVDEIRSIYKKTVPVLRKMVGAHRGFDPMYPNFPSQVMNASDLELYLNAMGHYIVAWVGDTIGVPARWLPSYKKDARSALPDQDIRLKVLHLGSQDDFNSIFTSLVGSNTSLFETDKEIVAWFIANNKEVTGLLPQFIPQKENLALVAGNLATVGKELSGLEPYLKTATDVLRVATVMSGGDVSLAKPAKFRKWNRKERRFFLGALEKSKSLIEDMKRWDEHWKRLAHRFHPFEYQTRFPRVCEAMAVIFGDKPVATFANQVEEGLKKNKLGAVTPLLIQRPGDFARRLDHLFRLSKNEKTITQISNDFIDVAHEVSTPVLLQVYNHFKNRSEVDLRAFFPKGNVNKVQVSEELLSPLPKEKTDSLATAIRSVLCERFSALSSLGNVYVDESLKNAVVPFAQRSASKALRTVARGSRFDMPDSPTLRFFLWWKDGESRTDIDLSAVFHDAKWNRMGDVSYYDLRNTGCCHSGDITSAPEGACEFIDLDLKTVQKRGVRYISMCLYSYTSQLYKDLPECFAGWMARSKPQSGEIFDARTVQNKIDLTADATVAIPVILDVVDRKVIWADVSLPGRGFFNNSRSNSDGVARMGKAIISLEKGKPNLYDLFSMHAEARGTLTGREEAETVFSLHEGITPYDIDKIMSEYMAN